MMSVQNTGLSALSVSEPMPDALNTKLRAATQRIRALLLLRYGSRAVCWSALVGTLALFGMYFLPTLPIFWSKEKHQEVEDVKRAGTIVVKLAQDANKTANQQDLKETKHAAAEAKKLGEAMMKAKMSKK